MQPHIDTMREVRELTMRQLTSIAMQYYEAALPADAPEAFSWAMPFASTMIRSLTGQVGFFVWIALTPVLIILPYALIYKQKVTPKEILGVCVSMISVALFFLL